MVTDRVLQPQDVGMGILFWTIRDAIIVGDVVTGTIALWNPAAERLFGWSAAAVVGESLELLIPEELRANHRAGLTHFAETGHGPLINGDAPVEVPARHKDGGHLTVELSLSPLDAQCTEQGVPRYVLALIRDATVRQRLATEREAVLAAAQAATARLEELVSLKAGVTAMVAHELGTPVATIRGLAGLLARGTLPASDQVALLAAIIAETDFIHRLVADVERAATVERDDFAVHPRPVAMAVVLAEAAVMARTLPDHPFIEDIDAAVLAAAVHADPERIGQVLRNLVGNAGKHTPPGTRIELRARRDGVRVRIEVADMGPGIPQEDLGRIFEKFGRGRDVEGRRVPGVGLGLYLSRRIIQAHGGTITITSCEGEGSVFGFSLEVVQ